MSMRPRDQYTFIAPTPPPRPTIRPPMSGWRIVDITITVVLTGGFMLAVALACYTSIFFLIVSPWPLVVVWGGACVAGLLVMCGVIAGALRRQIMFHWPLIGTAMVGLAFWVGWEMVLAAPG